MSRWQRIALGTTAYVVCVAVAWHLATSALFCVFLGKFSELWRFPFTAWFEVAHFVLTRSPPTLTTLTIRGWLSLVGAPVMPTVLLIAWTQALLRSMRFRLFRRFALTRTPVGAQGQVQRGVTGNLGQAVWMTMKQAKRLFGKPDPTFGGVVVGEAYDPADDKGPFEPDDRSTWGHGGRAKLLIDRCRYGSTHSMVFSGSGFFKSVRAVSTILNWLTSAVILDPSCELGPMTRKLLEEDHGKRVVFLDPEGDDGFNAFDWIDTSHRLAELQVGTVIGYVIGDPPKNQAPQGQFFRDRGRDMILAIALDLLWDTDPDAPHTLREVKRRLADPRIRQLLRAIHANSRSRMARTLAGEVMNIVAETFDGISASANDLTSWLAVPALAATVSGSSFNTAELRSGKLAVFVQAPLTALQNRPGFARVIIGCLLNAAYEANGDVRGRVLFLLDEVARLGRMSIVETALATARKYRVTMQLFWQDAAQLEAAYPGQLPTFLNAASWIAYNAVFDLPTAKQLSEWCGEYGALAYSQGDNTGSQAGSRSSSSSGRVLNTHEVKTRLLPVDEILHRARHDQQYVLTRGYPPLRCGMAIWFHRKDMAHINDSNFQRSRTGDEHAGTQQLTDVAV